jgi:cold shock CspA family protein
MKGTIKKILATKGFGFIKVKNEDEELYFHWSKTQDDFYYLKVGDEVEFDIEKKKDKQQAINVTSIF